MTFSTSVFAVDGNPLNSNFMRMMMQGAVLGSQGVVGALDCIVTAQSPAAATVNIAAGAVMISGVEAPYQGSYYAYNAGTDSTLTIAATGASPRSDMIVARAEDPTFSGSPWSGPVSGQIVYPRVISGVAAGATAPPAGQSCIPLARIDMPANTSTVAQSYITDLRTVCNPQQLAGVKFAAGSNPQVNWTTGTTPAAWPPGASWQVPVPSWATNMTVVWEISEVLWVSGTARGYLNPVFGASVTAPNLVFPQTLVSAPATSGSGSRHVIRGAVSQAVGPSLRGTTQTLQFAQTTDGTNTGLMGADEATTVTVAYTFQQLASLT